MSEVLVDVGIPAYRRADFIGAAIESVQAQAHTAWRLVVFDNGPGKGDVERAVTPYLSDPRISYESAGRELSLADNWTRAIHTGDAPYVALLNDDDLWHPGFLATKVDALEANPACALAFSDWIGIDEHGSHVGVRSHVGITEGVLQPSDAYRIFTRSNPIVPSASLVRRSAIETIGKGFDSAWHYCDWEMWARLAARFPVFYVDRQDNSFRRHMSANTFANREGPGQLVAMVDHIADVFAKEVAHGRPPSRLNRARNRSHVLLSAAGDVHMGGGWRASGPLYMRALREYPLAIFEARSLQMLSRTLLGRRGSHWVAGLLRTLS